MPPDQESQTSSKNKLKFSVDLRIITLLLLVAVVGMLAAWRPWVDSSNNDQTITVSGEAKITAEPDEYIFMPSYEFKNDNKDTALAELTKKSDELVKKLKELGVADSKIKINSDGYDYQDYYFDETSRQFTYTLRPTITIDNREFAQKIQDYLVSTSPSGQVSPMAGFSDAKQKELESKARDEATKDARGKADQSARNLGFKVGKVKSVDDATNFGGGLMYGSARDLMSSSPEMKPSSMSVQPGENELVYTVTVIYYVK